VFGFVHVVRGQQNGCAGVAQSLDETPRVASSGGVEPCGWFVEEEDLGPSDQAECEIETATLSTGEFSDSAAGSVVEPHQGKQLVWFPWLGIHPGVEFERFGDRDRAPQRSFLEHYGDSFANASVGMERIVSEDSNGAAGGAAEPFDHFDGRGLAGAVVAEQRNGFTLFDGEGHMVDCSAVAVGLGEVGNVDDTHGPDLNASFAEEAFTTSR
jgi:hypothetical protein